MNFYEICKQGDFNQAIEIFSKSTNLTYAYLKEGLYGACDGGHMKLVNFFIEKGATDWNRGMDHACFAGHLKIVKLMIRKGATRLDLYRSCLQGHTKIVDFLVNKGSTDWEGGLYGACLGGHMELVTLMATKALEWDHGLCAACERGHIEIVKFMITKGATNWDMGLYNAWLYNHAEIEKMMIDNGATNISSLYGWSDSKEKIIGLLYMNLEVEKLKTINGFDKLQSEITLTKTSILKSQVLLPDLLTIVAKYIIL